LQLFLVLLFDFQLLNKEFFLALFVSFGTTQALVGDFELNELWNETMLDAGFNELNVQGSFPQLEVSTLKSSNEADSWFTISCCNDAGDGFVGWESESNEEL